MSVFRLTAFHLAYAVIAVAQQLPFVPITGPNALRASSSLFEDKRGGLWLGGNEETTGLRYYDGSRFVNPVAGSFPRILITGMSEDSEGGIWLASSGGLFRLFRGGLTRMLEGTANYGITAVAPDVFVANVTKVGKDELVEADLIRISRTRAAWKTEVVAPSVPSVRFERDRFGNITYPCETGFCEFKSAEIEQWREGMNLHITRHFMATRSRANIAFRDHLGCVWQRSNSEVSYQCPGDLKSTVLPAQIASIGDLPLTESNEGAMIIPSWNRIAIGRPGKFRVITAANGYPSAGSVLVRTDGTIWLSNSKGLFVFPTHLQIEFWTERDGLDGNTFSILPHRKKAYAISGDMIKTLDSSRSRWLSLKEFRGATHLLRGPNSTIFASSRLEGVIQLSADGRILRRSRPTNALMLGQTLAGETWVTGRELSRIDPDAKGRLLLKSLPVPAPQGGGTGFALARDGSFWTTYAGGLLYKDKEGWHGSFSKNGFKWKNCFSFTVDHMGRIWCGTGGLYVVEDPKGATPKEISAPLQNQSGAEICCTFFGVDLQGRLWRGMPNGVYIAEPEQAFQDHWLELNVEDGLPGSDTNERSFVADSDGSVWFGIDNSVVHLFPPDDLVHPQHAPSVFVSGFSWNTGAFQMADRVETVENGSNLIAHLGSLQMDRRNALRFRYRLLPKQTSWKLERSRDISLGRLTWGEHRLEVQGQLGTGPWSASARKSFIVLRPIWLSLPVILSFGFAASGAAVGGYRWRKKRARRAGTVLPELAEWRLTVLSPQLESLEGTLLDNRFEICRMIARGGFATVWEGRDREHKSRVCAVKIFRHELINRNWLTERFQHEVSALKQVEHPNVVHVYGHGTLPSGAPYLVMELVDGKTLRELLHELRLTNLEIARYLRQTARALTEIHAHRICHRDVKPENLMIRSAAKPGEELVLIDFSIAIVQDPDETLHGLSRAAGTLYYMAPEQAIGYADPSSDIYSLAKIVIEMLTGERLSSLLPNASIDLPMRVKELLVTLRFGLSLAAIDLIAQALEFDPSRRPNNAYQFAAVIAGDLEKVV